MGRIRQHSAARRDLIEHFVYLAEHAGEATAHRFLDAAEASFGALLRNSGMGAPLTLRAPELAGLRKWCVSGFDNFLVFYLEQPDGVAVVRVLHAASDWWGLLEIEPLREDVQKGIESGPGVPAEQVFENLRRQIDQIAAEDDTEK
jgi:toxin ParE1/3/4